MKPKRTWRAISSSSSLPRLPGRMDAEVREVRALLGDAAVASPKSDWGRTPLPPAFPTPPHDLFRSGGASRSRTPTPMRYSSLGAPTRASPGPLAWPGDAAIDGDLLPPPSDPRQGGGERAATTPMCYLSLDCAPTRATVLLRTRNILPGNAGEKKPGGACFRERIGIGPICSWYRLGTGEGGDGVTAPDQERTPPAG